VQGAQPYKKNNSIIAFKEDILVFDIETYLDSNNQHIPYSCGMYSNKSLVPMIWYSTDYPNENIIE
jgi:hypothetical protein